MLRLLLFKFAAIELGPDIGGACCCNWPGPVILEGPGNIIPGPADGCGGCGCGCEDGFGGGGMPVSSGACCKKDTKKYERLVYFS